MMGVLELRQHGVSEIRMAAFWGFWPMIPCPSILPATLVLFAHWWALEGPFVCGGERAGACTCSFFRQRTLRKLCMEV